MTSGPEPEDLRPRLGRARGRVADYTVAGCEAYSRILIPIIDITGARRSWSEIARIAGATTTADASLATIRRHWNGDELRAAQGTIDTATAAAFCEALVGDRRTRFALWEGYGGELDPDLSRRSAVLPADGRDYLADGTFHVVAQRLDWLLARTAEQGFRAPVAVWPDDLKWCIAGPLYFDSLYFSGTHADVTALAGGGLEVIAVDPSADLPEVAEFG